MKIARRIKPNFPFNFKQHPSTDDAAVDGGASTGATRSPFVLKSSKDQAFKSTLYMQLNTHPFKSDLLKKNEGPFTVIGFI